MYLKILLQKSIISLKRVLDFIFICICLKDILGEQRRSVIKQKLSIMENFVALEKRKIYDYHR